MKTKRNQKMVVFVAVGILAFALQANAGQAGAAALNPASQLALNPGMASRAAPNAATRAALALHGAGNGGDGLELAPPDGGGGSVYVPVPGNLGLGTLLVSGLAGAGQTPELDVASCKSNASGQIAQFGCDDIIFSGQKYWINQPISLAPGNYLVQYSSTETFIQIQANQETQIGLKEIQTSNSPQGDVTARVFVDLTDPSMQSRALLSAFSNPENQIVYENECVPSSYNAKVCNAFSAGTPQALLNAVVQFNPDGSISLWNGYDQIANYGRNYVADITGQFISVIPGVYGIEFHDKNTGQSESQYGIQAE